MSLYRVKLCIARENSGRISLRNEIILPGKYLLLDETLAFIEADILHRLKNTLFFRSQRYGYDLVRYHNTAQDNTYLAYRVVIHEAKRPLLLAPVIETAEEENEKSNLRDII